jgi:hypothetical protein
MDEDLSVILIGFFRHNTRTIWYLLDNSNCTFVDRKHAQFQAQSIQIGVSL